MNRTDSPKKQAKPFGINGQREDILPTTPAGDNTASYDQGFPPVTMILKSAGGLPPKGQDMNQILYELSSLARWASSGAMNTYDSAFATAVSGYPAGSFVLGDDLKTVYRCTTNGNTTNPNTSTTGWVRVADDIASLLDLGTAAYVNTGSNPGEVVTAASDQPVYNSTLPTSGYTTTDPSGYFSSATVTAGDTLIRVVGLTAHNVAGNWTIVNSYGSHFGTGGSIQPEDAAHVLVSTDGASYTRRWYFYNNGTLNGPNGLFADQAWVNGKVGTIDGAVLLGSGINVQKVQVPDLPNIGYTSTSTRGMFATNTVATDSVTKAVNVQLTKSGTGGWGLGMSYGTYVGASGSVDDVAHLLCASDGASYSKRWWFYNNGNLVGPSGKMASQNWVSTNFAPIGSDVAIKDNVEPIKLDDALTFVRNNQTYSWDYKADGRHYVGFITEELKRDNPELVYAIGDMEINGEIIKGVEGTSAGNIAAGYLFPVVKHLLERAETAEGKLKDLEARIAALEGVKA